MLEEDPNEESYYKMGKSSGVPVSECNKTTLGTLLLHCKWSHSLHR